ncbi:MAG TPA: LPS export ABC transporter periplasmic protein LptC [Caulobacterales bacterium]|nr:LPS export ABC transporter periplasmic protein LptC [Caulobacterales bacterium]
MTQAEAYTSSWEPRRVLSLRQARRRSAVVAGLRRFFVAAAGASFASVFVFMAVSTLQGVGAEDRAASEPLRMLNPRFTGRTAQGGPFQITAETALRDRGGKQLVHLASPVYRAQDGTVVLAPRGVYDESARSIVLNGEVLFSERGGNRFSTSNMVVDLANGAVHGDREVTGAGPLGVVRADAYEIRQGDRALVLHGAVRGQIPDRGQPAPDTASEPAADK